MAGTSFLSLEGKHVLVTGAAGGIGGEAVREFLRHGCLVTGLDLKLSDTNTFETDTLSRTRLRFVQADLSIESQVISAIEKATSLHGIPPQILIANAGVTDESSHPPIWDLSLETWDRVSATNLRGTFLTIKHFLHSIKQWQEEQSTEIDNLAIVVTGSECGKFGQEGHAEYATGKAGLQYGLIKGVKNEIVRMNAKARINAVAPGWVDTPLIGDRLDDPREMWAEAQATVALKKIAKTTDVARAMAFLASHQAAGHISGQCLSVDGGMDGRLIWKESDIIKSVPAMAGLVSGSSVSMPPQPTRPRRRLRISLSVDFDAVSGYLGTGQHPSNTVSDYSAGFFSARAGVPRLLKLFKKHGIANKVTWFIPGHSMESFPRETKAIVATGCEIGLHGYSHEGAYQMSVDQEREVLEKCIKLATALYKDGKKPLGYRAPLYSIRDTTVSLLKEHDFLYDSSMNAHDSLPYFVPASLDLSPTHVPDWSKPASSWMHPLPNSSATAINPTRDRTSKTLVEIPTSWYTEDMTPLNFYPYAENSHGYVSTDVIEKMWWDRFIWLWENESEILDPKELSQNGGQDADEEDPLVVGDKRFGSIFPLIWHPESAGRAHVIGMIDLFIGRLVAFSKNRGGVGEITFERMEHIAGEFRDVHLS